MIEQHISNRTNFNDHLPVLTPLVDQALANDASSRLRELDSNVIQNKEDQSVKLNFGRIYFTMYLRDQQHVQVLMNSQVTKHRKDKIDMIVFKLEFPHSLFNLKNSFMQTEVYCFFFFKDQLLVFKYFTYKCYRCFTDYNLGAY